MSLTPSDYAGIENHQITLKFANALQLLAQQTVSKLESCVTVKSGLKGATVSPADQLGTFSTKTRENRYEETPAVNVSRTRRWYSPTMKHGAYIIDTFDSIKMDLNPQEGIVQSMLAAYHRDIDATILADFFAANKVGKDATSTANFDTTNIVAKTDASGDVLGKIALAISKLQDKDVDIEQEEIYMVVPPSVETALKDAGFYVSSDYQDSKVLTGKKLPPYGGVNFVRYNLAKTNIGSTETPNNVYRCPIFCKSGVGLGKWEDFVVSVDKRADLSNATQIYMEYALGATRLEEAKCAAIDFEA